MSVASESVIQRKRGSQSQLSLQSDAEHVVLTDNVIDESEHNSRFWNRGDGIFSSLLDIVTMHKSTKTALIAIAILVCVIAVILLLNAEYFAKADGCFKLDGEETCFAKEKNPYRLYGTKTAYHISRGNNSFEELNVGNCEPKVFYLFCRHATRYPDGDDIEEMIKVLPKIQEKIYNNSLSGKVKMCKEDLKNLENWVEKMVPDNDNKMSETGRQETILLAQRFKDHFPSLLGGNYSPERFEFQFTSRERTRTTAEAFAQGLFGDYSKNINLENSTNDMLQFHKECKVMQKRCKDPFYDTSEIDKFENGPIMEKVIESASERIDYKLNYADIKLILKACVFGYALNIGDTWCSLFTPDELKILEFGDDIDDYYKDAYGNKVNYEQACPVVGHIMDLFNTFNHTLESKAMLQFSHAGGIKKVYSIFGLFEDEKPLKADEYCLQQNRKWRSSFIAPFTSNLALVLYTCGTDKKIAAFLNEKPIKLGGCSDTLCSYDEFYEKYNRIAENCNLKDICCTCCKD